MTTQTLPGRRVRWAKDVFRTMQRPAMSDLADKVRLRRAATLQHVRDHAYTILGFGFIDAACFTHSLFCGLLVTGISWFAFEFKVGE